MCLKVERQDSGNLVFWANNLMGNLASPYKTSGGLVTTFMLYGIIFRDPSSIGNKAQVYELLMKSALLSKFHANTPVANNRSQLPGPRELKMMAIINDNLATNLSVEGLM